MIAKLQQGVLELNKIAFHSENGPSFGGSDLYMAKLIQSLDKNRYQVYLYVVDSYPVESVLVNSSGIKVVHVPFGRPCGAHAPPGTALPTKAAAILERKKPGILSRAWRFAPRSAKELLGLRRNASWFAKSLEQNGIDLFHAMDGGPISSPIGARLAGCSVIVGYNAPPPQRDLSPLELRYATRCYQSASARIVKSRFVADAWSDVIGSKPSEFTVIPNGDDFPYQTGEQRRAIREQFGIPANSVVVGMTGQLKPHKGGAVFFEALPAIAAKCPEAVFVVVGDGPERSNLEARARELGVSERVYFLGFQQDAWRITACFDVAVVPSLFDEPFGWVVIEAMAQEVPVVASSVGGIPEIIASDQNGLLFEPGSPSDLAKKVIQLIQNSDERDMLGNAGLVTQRSRFHRRAMIESTLALYERLLGTLGNGKPRSESILAANDQSSFGK